MSDEASNILADEEIYRSLQEHLDDLPVGYPPTESGVEIRILKQLFTPEEAKIASMMKFSWKNLEPLESIYERTKTLGYSIEEIRSCLDKSGLTEVACWGNLEERLPIALDSKRIWFVVKK